MKKLLSSIRIQRKDFCKMILENITNYTYREQRYHTHFALVLLHIEDAVYEDEIFENILRLTDMHISLTPHLHCIILDSVSNKSYIKAAENIQHMLLNKQKNTFYTSAVESENYKGDYFKMNQTLFNLLEYAIEHNFSNTVIESDSNI